MNNELNYWREHVAMGAEDCDLVLTETQLNCIAESVMGGHEHYGMAFYSPPDNDRLNDIERSWQKRYDALKKELEDYQSSAETAVRRLTRQHRDTQVSIGSNGEVYRHGGRTEQIA